VAVDKRVYKNVKLFMENKKEGDDLFDRLNTTILNQYLTSLMDGLTAKVPYVVFVEFDYRYRTGTSRCSWNIFF
jgi:DNA topoisomerase IB